MATCNFDVRNASKICAFALEFDGMDYNDAIGCAGDALSEKGWDSYDPENVRGSHHAYNTVKFADKTKEINFAGLTMYLTMQAQAVSGYYQGAAFDWDGTLEVCDDNGCIGEYDLTGNYAVCGRDILTDEWIENKGMCKIQEPRIMAKISEAVAELQAECEAAFEAACDVKLQCQGVFGNGEAIYAEVA